LRLFWIDTRTLATLWEKRSNQTWKREHTHTNEDKQRRQLAVPVSGGI
jgi:hypothetical protein